MYISAVSVVTEIRLFNTNILNIKVMTLYLWLSSAIFKLFFLPFLLLHLPKKVSIKQPSRDIRALFEENVGKGENLGTQYLLLFPQ